MRNPGPVTIPFTVDWEFNEQLSLMQLKQAIGSFNFQLPATKLTLGQTASRLQANGMITLLEMTLPTQDDAIADVIITTAVPKWVADNGLKLKPEIEANYHLLTFGGGTLSIYGEATLEFSTGNPLDGKGSLTGGLQIRWKARAEPKQAKKKK
ncbi:MAG: hypothetical protein ACRD0A_17785 [Acidimicrobiales bacterium]